MKQKEVDRAWCPCSRGKVEKGVFHPNNFHTRSSTNALCGIDLHKKTITLCVVNEARRVVIRKTFRCLAPEMVLEFLEAYRPYRAVVEATASYEWLVRHLEPQAERVILAHPKKLRVIAESTRKNDNIDAQVLAEFLALDMIPQAYRPTPRQHDHRRLVRHRCYLVGQMTSRRNKVRRILSDYNADRKGLFTKEGLSYLQEVEVSQADRFVLDQLVTQWHELRKPLREVNRALRQFAEAAPVAEREARAVLESVPMLGPVTADVIQSELGHATRFRSQKKAVAYAGLAPGIRESAGKAKQLAITKEGSRLLRWAMVELAWRVVVKTQQWNYQYQRLRLGSKKAIVAIARRLLALIVGLLHRGERYRFGMQGPAPRSAAQPAAVP